MDETCDVLVVGSGAAGFAAAVTAAADGLHVIMLEKADVFGGSTCYSAGLVWIPDSRQARAAGLQDTAAAALRYLESEAGTHLDTNNARVRAAGSTDSRLVRGQFACRVFTRRA